MECTVSKGTVILLCLVGFVFSDDDSGSSESSDSEEFSRTPPDYFAYKVRGLNTALYYILHALQEDLKDGVEEIDTSFFKRIDAVATKIRYFYGEVDETNALMLGEILRTLPEYLKTSLEQFGYNFQQYTAKVPSDTETTTTIVTTMTTTIDGNKITDSNLTADADMAKDGNVTIDENMTANGNMITDSNVITDENIATDENVTLDGNVTLNENMTTYGNATTDGT